MSAKLPPTRNYPGARALLLPRVSTVKQREEGTSLESQEQALRLFADARHYQVVDCLPDAHTGTDLYRPALNEARQMIRDNQIDVIVVYAYDRFFRNQAHQTIFIYDARQYGVAVESATEKLDDSVAGRMTATMLGLLAELDREKILERTQRGSRGRVEKGRIKTGPTPLYGYVWVDVERGSKETHDYYQIDEEVAWVVRFIFEEVCKLKSLRAVAQMLDTQHVLTPSYYLLSKGYKLRVPGTSEWNFSSVRNILKNPAYMGQYRAFRRHNEDIFVEHEESGRIRPRHIQRQLPEEETVLLPSSSCPAIVSEATWYAAQEALKRNYDNSPRNLRHRECALLAGGFIFCGHCGRRATVNHLRKKTNPDFYYYQYRCLYTIKNSGPRCSHGFCYPAQLIDDAVWFHLRESLEPNPKTGHSLLEDAMLAGIDGPDGERAMKQSSINAAERALKDKIAERNNWERNQADDMKREYDAAYVGRIQFTLNHLYKEIAELEKGLEQDRRDVQSISNDISTIHAAIRKLDPLRENLQAADWSAKRKWLYLLGITVHVYHRGTFDDGYGNPFEIRHNGIGLKEIIGDLQNDDSFACTTSSAVAQRTIAAGRL